MEPVEGNKTRLTLVLEIDLKGNLPQTILRQANKDQGFQIDRLRTVLADYVKKENLTW